MKTKTKENKGLIALMMGVVMSCTLVTPEADTPSEAQGVDVPTNMSDKIASGKVFYAANEPCKAGDYSQYPTGIKDITVECYEDGGIKKLITYADPFHREGYRYITLLMSVATRLAYLDMHLPRVYHNSGRVKASETIYNEDGAIILFTIWDNTFKSTPKYAEWAFRGNGTALSYKEWLREDQDHWGSLGDLRIQVFYRSDGTRQRVVSYVLGEESRKTYYDRSGKTICRTSDKPCI